MPNMMVVDNKQKRQCTAETAGDTSKKKRKVEFDIAPQAQDFQGGGGDSKFAMEMFESFVIRALKDLDNGECSGMESLAMQVSLPATDADRISIEKLTVLLRLLGNNISKIDNSKSGASMIRSIINFEKWWELPGPALSSYISFIRILCSSLPKWWQDVSMALISNFALSPGKTVQHHEMLKYFLKTIPSSIHFIDTYIGKFFPNKNDSKKVLLNFISNVLALTEYCHELRFQAWSLVIEKVISIDVELQNELDELDEDIDDDAGDDDEEEDEEDDDDEEDDAQEPTERVNDDADDDMDDDMDDDEDLGDSDDDEAEVEVDGDEVYYVDLSHNIKELSSKLDEILSVITSKLSCALTPESLEEGDGVNIFNTLTSLFKSHILPTYYTRSVQYLMFHVSQQQPELMDAFLVTLIDISFSPTETMEKKIKSLQYIGSFIARAKKMTRTQIVFVTSYLTSWLNRYVLEREEEVDQPGGMERFKHFYAVFQAICYIFCFRHSLLRDGDDAWECELDKFFQRLVISKFNPLKYCNENVMMMFAKIAQHEGVVYCFSIIENNNNERLRGITGKATESGGGSSVNGSWSLATRQQFIDLQSYFPYDPLFLTNYKTMMKDYYIEWTEVSKGYDSDVSEELDESP
ncbi:DNA independent RNA polymerase I transcription factor [Kluyveromyces marxianus]|nr:DNA independent RNA polymerase I transcription factor [Kluyveromyces marxianus]KAG0675534.1 DNA independent RNA polymerase I transcription factor [Kluyveromyces marxianus]